MCKKNFIPISIGFCVIALQSYREIIKKYRKKGNNWKNNFSKFWNLNLGDLGNNIEHTLPGFLEDSCIVFSNSLIIMLSLHWILILQINSKGFTGKNKLRTTNSIMSSSWCYTQHKKLANKNDKENKAISMMRGKSPPSEF